MGFWALTALGAGHGGYYYRLQLRSLATMD